MILFSQGVKKAANGTLCPDISDSMRGGAQELSGETPEALAD
jgi:hypothetical protein